MRSAVGQASNAANTAASNSANLGSEAQGIGANLTPFLNNEMEHPQGYSQQDQSAMLSAGLAGAGGANAGLNGQAMQRAAVSRNGGAFQAALADAARSRDKAAAGASESIAAQNADLKQRQQQAGAAGLEGLYGKDLSGMLEASGQIASDVNAQVNAGNSGWLQNTMGILGQLNTPGFKGFSLGKH